MVKVFALSAAVLLLAVPAADAQRQLTLEIQDGLVTLSARDVPVRTIMSEWAEVGGTNVVNGDQLGGAPITLELEAVPELEALDIDPPRRQRLHQRAAPAG